MITTVPTHKKAQSFLEYSLLIAAAVTALVVMQYYLSRSTQGFIKSQVDNLGGEKLGQGKYGGGKWFAGNGSNYTQLKTSGDDLEVTIGVGCFSVSFSILGGQSHRLDHSQATGIDRPPAFVRANYLPLLPGGEDAALINTLANSSFNPGMEQTEQNVNNQTDHWQWGYGDQSGAAATVPQPESYAAPINNATKEVVDKYSYSDSGEKISNQEADRNKYLAGVEYEPEPGIPVFVPEASTNTGISAPVEYIKYQDETVAEYNSP
jgi:hypothetical protein